VTTREQTLIARAALAVGRRFGIGGTAWTVSRATGDGVSMPVSRATVGTWTGYVVDETTSRLGSAAPDATVGAQRWYAVGASAALAPTGTLAIGDVLTSASNAALVFDVAAVDQTTGYARFVVRQVR
jgi:hypothetical protein